MNSALWRALSRRLFRLSPPWWVAPFVTALFARLLWRFLVDEPLLYSHPYNYFHGALRILDHATPLQYVLRSDNWHQWMGPWTIAPLYYLFVAALLALDRHLLAIQLAQYVLDALVAVGVGWLGRRIAGARGVWAGIVYAVNFHAIEQSSSTLTENLHTPLLVASLVFIVAEADRARMGGARRGWALFGGWLLGLSALSRSVSTAFVPMAALWRWAVGRGRRTALLPAALVLAGGVFAILPWTLRNAVFIGDFVPVETNAVYNFWDDNAFVDGAARSAQETRVAGEPTLARQRARMMRFGLRGIVRHPERFAEKAWINLLHFIRPDGLHQLLIVEDPMPWWRHALLVFLDDLIVLPTVVLLLVFLAAGRVSPARGMIALWTAYYVLMVVVVFHNEIRYRSTLLPFALAGAAGGLAVLADAERRRRPAAALALIAGVALVALVSAPYAVPLWRASRSAWALRGLESELGRGTLDAARTRVAQAAGFDPAAARPWLRYGSALARADCPEEAISAFERAARLKPHVWVPVVVRPALLRAAGREAEAATATAAANTFSWHSDPWLALEAAWRALPAPRADEVRLGANDYGAARGFMNPRPDHRWSRGRACLRLRPAAGPGSYELTVWMGLPPPAPAETAIASLRPGGGDAREVTVTRAVTPHVVRTASDAAGVVIVCLDAPTWNALGEPAEQGLRVERVSAVPIP